MSKKIFLTLCLAVIFYICWVAPGITATFLTSLSFAYLLHPLARKLSELTSLSLTFCANIIFLLFIMIFSALLAFLIPKFIEQAEGILLKIPELQRAIRENIIPAMVSKFEEYGGKAASAQIKIVASNMVSNIPGYASNTANYIWRYAVSTVHFLIMFCLFPVVLFFFLKDWPIITKNFKLFITKIGFDFINDIWDEADDLISGFVKSIFNVGIILAVIYVFSLYLIGFEFALILGVIAGFLAIIPMIGPFCAFMSCLMLSVLTHGIDIQQLWITLVFVLVQGFDGTFLTPKIVGDSIGLHPTAIIFAVLVGAKVLGVAGLFIAIPIAGMIKIIFKRFVFEETA